MSNSNLWAWHGPTPENRQGWKIHINVGSQEIVHALSRCRSALQGVPHKTPRSPGAAAALEADRYSAAAGKLVTAYPRTRDEAGDIVAGLTQALAGLHGPLPSRDRRLILASCVSYRYGSVPNQRLDLPGPLPTVTAPDGSMLPDRMNCYLTHPPWERDLFSPSYGHDDLENEMIAGLRHMLAVKHLDYSLLKTGAIWVARIGGLSRPGPETSVAKWAVCSLLGASAVRRIADEAEMIESLPADIVPRVQGLVIGEHGAVAVVEDLGDGEAGATAVKSAGEYQRLRDGLLRLKEEFARRGGGVTDLSPANLRWRGSNLVLVDVEAAGRAAGPADMKSASGRIERQREATLTASLLGVAELSRPGPYPWQAQAAGLVLRSLEGPSADLDDQQSTIAALSSMTALIMPQALASLSAAFAVQHGAISERGARAVEEMTLFRGFAGLVWALLAAGQLEDAYRGACLLMADPGLMRRPGGLYFGGAGVSLTVAAAGLATGAEVLVDAGELALRDIAGHPPDRADLFSGVAGQVIALSAIAEGGPGARTREALNASSRALAAALTEPARLGRDGQPRRGLGYGVDGLWLAAATALGVLEDGRARQSLQHALIASLNDAPQVQSTVAEDSLCRGRAGMALAARLACDRLPGTRAEIPAPNGTRAGSAGVCHGIAGQLLAGDLVPADASGDGWWSAGFRRRILSAVLACARQTDAGVSWIDDRTGQPGPALMTGSAGVIVSVNQADRPGSLGLPHAPGRLTAAIGNPAHLALAQERPTHPSGVANQ
jgi:hypothetical protein